MPYSRLNRLALLLGTFAADCLIAAAANAGDSAFDGKYAGQKTVVRSGGTACPPAGPMSTVIKGGSFTVALANGVTLTPEVGKDGSFSDSKTWGREARASIQGRIAGNAVEADYVSGLCAVHWSLKKE